MKKLLSSMPRWASIFGFGTLIIALYLITNYFQIFECKIIPLLPNESNIPCLESTFVIYLSLFIYVPLILFILPKQYFITCSEMLLWVTLGYFVLFVVFPTTYPREEKQWSDISLWILNIDMPTNVFPSLHIFWVTSLALVYLAVQRNWKGMLIIVWAILICISTLTTKQHYVLDIVVSIVISIIAHVYLYLKKLSRP